MPTVPRRAPLPTVGTAPLPTVRAVPNAPSGAFAPSPTVDLSGATDAIAQQVQKARQEAMQTALLDADNQLSDVKRTVEGKMLQLRGRDVLGARDTLEPEWQSGVDQITDTIQNPDVRRAFQSRVAQQQGDLLDTLERHTSVELDRYQNDEYQSALQHRYDDAAANPLDPQNAQRLAEARALTLDNAKRQGLGPEATQAADLGVTSKFHLGVLSSILASQAPNADTAARSYYDTNKEQIAGGLRPEVEKTLEAGTLAGESQRQSDAILGQAATLTDAMHDVRQITDPKLRDAVQTRVENEFAVRDRAQRDQQEQDALSATQTIERTGNYFAIPPTLLTRLPLGVRSSLRAYAVQVSKGEPVVTDQPTWYGLMQQAASTDPSQQRGFANLNLLAYKAKLSDSDFQQLAAIQLSLRKGDSKADAQLADFGSQDQLITGALSSAGINPSPKPGSDDATRVVQFRRSVADEAIRVQQATGKKIGTEQLQRIVDDLIISNRIAGTGVFGSRFFQTQKRGFELTIRDVPALDRQQITSELTRRGLAVTDTAVLDLFRRRQALGARGTGGPGQTP